jgi:catechol 2,3-dioxygenase-like lactoylglutathione lyase family enzyme
MQLSGIKEILLPASDLDLSKQFYLKLGYKVVNELPWGMIQMAKEEGPGIALVKKDFFANPSLSLQSLNLNDCISELEKTGIVIDEDDRNSEPSRIVIHDPDGFEITIT